MAFRQIKSPALATAAVTQPKVDVTAVSGQTAVASIQAPSLDSFLIHDTTADALRKVTASSFIGSFSTDDLAVGSDNLYFTDALAQAAVAQDIADAVAAEAALRTAADLVQDSTIAGIQSEVDATQVGAGLGTDGTYSANGTADYISTATSLADADNKLDVAMKAIDTAYKAADVTLQGNIDFITSNVDQAALDSLVEIVNAFQAADDTLDNSILANTGLITAETTRATNEESRIEGKVDATQAELDATQTGAGLGADGTYTAPTTSNFLGSTTSLKSADSALDTALKAEESARTLADAGIQADLDSAEAKIGSAALDTTASDLSAAVNELHGEVDAEVLRATTAEGVISANLTTETTARGDEDTAIRGEFAAADAAIQGELDATQVGAGLGTDGTYVQNTTTDYIAAATNLNEADRILADNIKANDDRAIAAENALDTRLTTEEGNIDTLQTEVQALEDVVGDVANTPLDTTATDLGGAINEIHGEVDAIEGRVTQSESDIADNLASINNIISNTDSAALDSLAEIVTAFQNADSTLTGLVNANAAAVNVVESSIGLNADGTYAAHSGSNYLDAATSVKAALGLLDTQNKTNADAIAQEVLDRQSDVDAEESRATAVEGAIQSELDTTQAGLGLGTDGTYTAPALANYISAATSMADADNKLDAAIKTVADNLASEISTTDGEVSALQGRMTTAEGDIVDATTDRGAIRSEFAAGDATLQGNIDTLSGEVDTTQTGAGLAADGSYVANVGTNYLGTATSLKDATEKLDAQAKTNADNLAAEIVNRENDVDAEQARAEGEEARIEGKVDNEVSRATAADAQHDADILANTQDIATNVAAILTEKARAEGIEAGLRTDVDQNAADIVTQTGRIDDVLQGADGALDTLKEIGDAFEAADSNLQNLITTNGGKITTLEGEMDAVEGRLDTVEPKVTTLEGEMDAVEADVAAIEAVVGDLGSTPLDTTAGDLAGAINEIHGEVDANVAEVTATQAAVGLNADGSYAAHSGSNFMDSATTVKGALTALDGQAKTNADDIVSGDNTVRGEFAAADTSIRTDFGAADTVLQQAIDTAEASIGLAADGSYAAPVGSNFLGSTTTVKGGLTALDGQAKTNADAIAQETSDRAAGDLAEKNRAEAEEARIEGLVSTEVARATGVEAALDTRLTTAEGEITDTQAGAGLGTDGSYTADPATNHLTAATSLKDADKKLDTAIKAENTRALLAEGALDTRLTTEEGNVDALQAFTGEGTSLDTTSGTLAGALNEVHGEVDAVEGRVTQNETDIAANLASINNIISNTDQAALDSLTEIVAAFQSADSTLTGLVQDNLDELNAIETGAGLGTDGTYTAPSGTDFLGAATSLSNADELLDSAIKAVDTAYKAADAAHDTQIAARLQLSGGTMTGSLAMGGNVISGLADPSNPQDAVTKAFLDAAISAQDISVYSTDDLVEGATNLYFTDARSRAAISVVDNTTRGGVASYNNTTGVITVNADHSVLDATDVSDSDFTNKAEYVLAVTQAEDGMELVDVSTLSFATPNRITINGDGTTKTFALGFATTQSDAMVFVGGVVQDPTSHYTVNGSAGTITFTDAMPVGTQAVIISHMLGSVPYLEANSVTFDKFSTDIKAFVQQSAVSAGTGGAVVDSFDGTAYRSAKYIIQVDNGSGEYETREALVVHDGTSAYITEYALVYTGASLIGDATVAMNGNQVELSYTANSGTATVKVISTYIDA